MKYPAQPVALVAQEILNAMMEVSMTLARVAKGSFLVAFLASLCSGQEVKQPLKRTFTYDRDVETSFQWPYIPRWDGASLVGLISNHSNGPVLLTIDRDGKRDETLFTLQDAGHINLFDMAVSSKGEIATVGDAIGGERGTSFVARISSDRKDQIVTRTWPYCPMVVTFAPDGTIWTIGHLKDEANTREVAFHVLRRFDPSGKLLGSTMLHIGGRGTDETSYLRSSKDRVGWYTRSGEYIEFSLDGTEMARYDGPAGVKERDISGVALSSENDFVLARQANDKSKLDMLDRQTRTWIPVSIPAEFAPTYLRVYGFDGTTLVTAHTGTELRRFNTKTNN